MKSILVPTDFSECAEYASKMAIQLARKSGAILHFIHLIEVPVDWLYSGTDLDKRYPDISNKVKKAKNALDGLVREAERQDVVVKTNIEYNQDYSIIITYTEQHAIDLIVMGSHGTSGIKELFIGSHTQKIVRLSQVPVLVIKHSINKLEIKQIVFAYDFESEAQSYFQKVIDFASLLGAKIHLLFVNTPLNFKESQSINQILAEYARLAPQVVSSTNVYDSFSFEKGLINFCHEKEGDMIVMLTHGRKGMFRLLNSSVTERVIDHVNVPVMSLNIHHKDTKH
ncbi:universal stress protein [Catalinimonas sp. 4WD22]|uniref:universal stress protein n=1 Tax=Catalinimonas locisalis TaxID=3133978 RepID=UPI003100D85C